MVTLTRITTGNRFAIGILCLISLAFTNIAPSVLAQQPAAGQQPASAPAELSISQQQLLRDYERFEKSLFDVGEQLRHKDPDRAGLLYRARGQSQEQNILAEMGVIAELLRSQNPNGGAAIPQYGPAADRQQELITRMEAVLKLLQSLDDRERISAEINRLQDLLKDNNRLIARQKDVRADTQRGRPSNQMQDAQRRVGDEAKRLSEKIDKQDQERQKDAAQTQTPSPNSTPSGKPDGKQTPPQPGGQQQPAPQGESSPSPQTPQKPAPGSQSQQPPSPADKKNQQQPDSQRTPGREELEQARQQIEQAMKQLQGDKRDDALESQEQAVSQLEKMKAQLEEILRQLRQDERESYLTLLEARFQNMVKREERIKSETVRLNGIEVSDRPQQNYASQTDNIRKEQDDNALEAEKTLSLLKQEGSSVAFPEAVEQMYKNMRVIASRLAGQDTGGTTQLVEQLVVETLQEMISALQKELEQQQANKQNPPQPGGSGQQETPGLVNQIAELKLIRSLQNQVNRLTIQIGTEIEGKEPSDPQQLELIRDLASRQQRIQDATYDLSVGKNK